MKNLNFSRELYQYVKNGIDWSIIPPSLAANYDNITKLHYKSVKFILPDGGRIRLQVETQKIGEKLHLPFENICIEYQVIPKANTEPQHKTIDGKIVCLEPADTINATKRIIFVTQLEDKFLVTIAYYQPDANVLKWTVLPVVKINRSNYDDIIYDKSFNFYDYWDEIISLYSFIKIINCVNVEINKNPPSISDKLNKKRNGFIPYDSYHILTLNTSSESEHKKGSKHNSHKSPRKHIRRGHIRIMSSGKQIWINETIINKKAPYEILKDYSII